MATDWEGMFSRWSRPPGQTETERIENACRAVRDALDASDNLRAVTRVYAQGSYRNRVNVRADSDVDLGVLYTGNSFYAKYPDGMTAADFGNVVGDTTYAQFKNDVEVALKARFGRGVTRSNKAFDVHGNTYRIDADVVPTMVHRRYGSDGSYICGVELYPDQGGRIINWPERLFDDSHWPAQHYENAVCKNNDTGRRFKGVVRILKTLRNQMDAEGIAEAKPILGFLVECMVWNVPGDYFGHDTLDGDVQATLGHLWSNLKTAEACHHWGEVSELKYVFRGQEVKRAQAWAFVDRAWTYTGVRGT